MPFADNSVYKVPDELSDEQVLLVASGRLDPTIFATHRFALDDKMGAYDTFADAVSTKALKVVPEGSERAPGSDDRVVAASE